MRSMLLRILACLVLSLSLSHAAAAQGLVPVNLRCEYLVDPLGIDQTAPRLSWELRSGEPLRRGQKQVAYQVLVASSEEQLAGGQADLWDSGRVESDATNQIVYAGKPLGSRQQCVWKVRTWNERGEESPWSQPARWSMGLLEPSDWSADWIGYDAPPPGEGDETPDLTLDDAKWVWHAAAPAEGATQEWRHFRRSFELPGDRQIASATLLLTADDHAEVYVNGTKLGRAGSWRRLHRMEVDGLKAGRNTLAIAVDNAVGSPAALVGKLRVDFEDGEPLILPIDASWKVSPAAADGWETPDFDDSAWPAATEIAAMGDAPWGKVPETELRLPPPPQLRKTFAADKPVKRATMYATALGLYELYLNGQRVGDIIFAPGWTDYRKRVYYNTYDVTALVNEGENVLAGLLGDGWYAGYVGFGLKRELYGAEPRLRAQLEIEYEDGSKKVVNSDGSWKAAYGALREADFLMGCTYDANLEQPWMRLEFDDSSWASVTTGSEFNGLVQAYRGVPVRRQEEIKSLDVTEPKPGVYVFDLKQNMVGWVRLKGVGKKGQPVTIRHAEMLNPDGTPYLIALRGARSVDTYTPSRDGEFEFEPSFTFHGFQYVEVTGLDAPPSPEAVTGIVVHSDIPPAGLMETSSPLVNQLLHNIKWGQKGNYLEVPTDCPQRDERLGWTGDAQFFMRTAAYNFDVASFFNKWLVDLDQDSQNEDGAFAAVAPDVLNFSGAGATGWADAGIICPYAIWQFYGDTRVIDEHWVPMSRYIDYLENTSRDLIRTQGAYGDWVNLGGGAKSEVIGTAYFAYVTGLMAEMAHATGREDDARSFSELASRIRARFIEEFVNEDGSIEESSQTGYALAFTMDLLPEDKRDEAAERFIEELGAKDWHLATGFIGTPRLLPALTEAGEVDAAYRLLLQETFPSWLFQVKLGATTMWERWDGWTPEKGFQDPGMNSFNHYAFGSVGEWLYDTAAGITSDGPGFRKIIIRPRPGPGLSYVNTRYDSINGRIISNWKIENGKITLNVTIPPNTTATVYVPTAEPHSITDGGERMGMKYYQALDGVAVIGIGSGTYEFSAIQPRKAWPGS
jgi:alpha-L-rhamnosidase